MKRRQEQIAGPAKAARAERKEDVQTFKCPACDQDSEEPNTDHPFTCPVCTLESDVKWRCSTCSDSHQHVSCALYDLEKDMHLQCIIAPVKCVGCETHFSVEGQTGKDFTCPECTTRSCWLHRQVIVNPVLHWCANSLYPNSTTFDHTCILPGCGHIGSETACCVDFSSPEEALRAAALPHERAMALYCIRTIRLKAPGVLNFDDFWNEVRRFF